MKTPQSVTKAVSETRRSATGGWLGRFWSDQSGTMSYVAVAGAMVMMVFGGIGVDMIHAELKRTKIQNTLDRAVLAAAAVENEMDAETTVQEYFNAMNLADALGSVDADVSARNKRVSADAAVTMPSQFMQLIGVDTLQATGDAVAEQGITEVEISLILDTSGSMGGTKIEQLKTASKNFVDTVLAGDGVTSPVSVSLVPYHATVSLGDDLPNYFNLQNLHDFSHCAVFDDSEFSTTAITPTQELEQLGQFDPISSSQTAGEAEYSWCNRGNDGAIMAVSSDADALKARIDTFEAWGNTAIDVGVKWGAALLDPAARPAISAMAYDGLVSQDNAARPANFNDQATLKYLVVMTDGQNTWQYDLKPEKKEAAGSGIWLADMGTGSVWDDKYSVQLTDPNTGAPVYYWTRYWYNASQRYQPTVDMIDHPSNPARELTWNEIYDRFGTNGLVNLLYWQPRNDGYISSADYADIQYPYEVIVTPPQADSRLSQVCTDAKNKGIVVYAVGVQAPEAGKVALQDCASSPSHYYDIDGSELDDTFGAIARSFQTLRLIQ
ncbi:TadE/TadG family type IV pilus assembly protein [Thalassococcus lentus]|uniref:TadE/TadG family protein n=1 Tax=Thalassococcus lentus TaxID=1210524 RepID=A0ABT4XVV7_9RHOB|nr:TadE/TadG family type IV pilus assembly protein [Thalassococcus lentus]MDA7426092.1 TadE/TadG family protein [Thalassococcus lentus]